MVYYGCPPLVAFAVAMLVASNLPHPCDAQARAAVGVGARVKDVFKRSRQPGSGQGRVRNDKSSGVSGEFDYTSASVHGGRAVFGSLGAVLLGTLSAAATFASLVLVQTTGWRDQISKAARSSAEDGEWATSLIPLSCTKASAS